MVVLWLVSIRISDVSIVDSFWGLAFVVSAWIYRSFGAQPGWEGAGVRWLQLALVTLWGVRLSVHIALRHAGQGGEDRRYRKMRAEVGDSRFRRRSLVTVFLLQGLLVSLISIPLLFVQSAPRPDHLVWTDILGLVLFALGFSFEAVSDWQLTRFRREPANAGRVLDSGLWRYSRHPNYFGEAVLWIGFGCFALASPGGVWSLLSVALMIFLLLRVSGVKLLESDIAERRPEYRRYVESTSSFLPWIPGRRKGGHGTDSLARDIVSPGQSPRG
ncbi:MAG: DUF1295 domain-containing protein [Thermoanaerobaculia bacterium]|nr:DUF1295 domain-containing protein [Thermoanaerobaculia bacterium]